MINEIHPLNQPVLTNLDNVLLKEPAVALVLFFYLSFDRQSNYVQVYDLHAYCLHSRLV